MSDEMAKVQRFSRTEKAIRAMDATDIVEMVHAMEDERDALRAALDAAEKDSDAWRKSNWALLTERDAALAARDAAWRAVTPLGLKGHNIHGLRKLAAVRLAEAGCSAHEIASITGHKSLAQVELYTAAADQERLARGAVIRLQAVSSNRKKPAD